MANNIKFGEKLTGKNRYKKLYHYTSFDSFVRIWCTKSLKFGEVMGVNDIQEKDRPVTITNMQQLPLGHALNNMRNKTYKQLSFTMDFDIYLKGCMSPMMWGYYGGKCSGVCIELNFDKLKFPKDAIKGPVRYVKYLKRNLEIPPDLETGKDIKIFIKKNAKELFLTKQKSWSNENEYRVVCPDQDKLDISNAISAVYLTSCDSLECMMVEKLLENTGIPIQFLHYESSGYEKIAVPVLTDTKKYREQIEKAKSNPDNALAKIFKQAEEHYKKHKEDENASLIKKEYKL